jgi:hypothetical protein
MRRINARPADGGWLWRRGTLRCGFALLAGCGAGFTGRLAAAETGGVPLVIDPASVHHLEITQPAADIWELRTTGVDPFVATRPFPAAPPEATVLTFEYVALQGIKAFEVFAGFPWSEARAQAADELPQSEGWSTFSLDLRPALARGTAPLTRLRLDFGREPGHVLQVRNLRLRNPDPREEEINRSRVARREADDALDRRIRAALARSYPARLRQIEVKTEEIAVAGNVATERGELWLAESPIWEQPSQVSLFPRLQRIAAGAGGEFALVVPRYAVAESGRRDRLYSRFLVIRAGAAGDEILSACRYADRVVARHDLPPVEPRSKKGMGGFNVGRADLTADLDHLGIASVTVNLFLSRLLRGPVAAGTMPFTYLGRTYHADRGEVEKLDRTLLAAAARDALVFGILLVPKAEAWATLELGRIMQHPDCEPAGIYSMANVTSAAGVEHYAALVDFLAERYSRPARPHGRIHHWIVHNEVDAGWTWTNCGEKPPVLYLDQYHKSMRLAHLIARQYDPHARAYVSLTHYWTWTGNFRYTPGREVLKHLLAFSRAEGDFDWGIAHHPYPESLREPKTWLDRKATFAFDTPLITFKNLEVLDAWVRLPQHRFRGESVRSVHLTEQGPNSRDYSQAALQEQAASLAYVWQKVRALGAIEGFQFHNWIDNRREGGLRIGLRRFPDDAEEPLGAKPVWHVFRALDTPAEAEVCAFALSIVGVKNWSEVLYRGPITGEP